MGLFLHCIYKSITPTQSNVVSSAAKTSLPGHFIILPDTCFHMQACKPVAFKWECRQKPQTCNFLTCPESKRDAGNEAAFGLVSSGQSKKERTHPQIEFISTAPGIERTRQKKCGKKIRARRIFVAWPAGRHSTGMRLCNQFSSWAWAARGGSQGSCHVRVSAQHGPRRARQLSWAARTTLPCPVSPGSGGEALPLPLPTNV